MHKRQILKKIAALMLVPCMLYGCGKKEVQVPELIDSVSGENTYRTIDRGNVGDETIYYGYVVPREYTNSWNAPVCVEDINVEIGDYVHEGDVLAVVDDEEIRYSRNTIQAQIDNENELENFRANIYELEHQEIELKINGYDQAGDTQNADMARNELANLEENRRFDIMMHDFRIQEYNRQMEKVNEISVANSLVANHDGYVTYIIDLSDTDVVGANENVVTISDYDDKYIEVTDYTVDKYKDDEEKIRDIYITIAGKKYSLIENEYSPREMIEMENLFDYKPLRLQSGDDTDDVISSIELGTAVPVCIRTEIKEDVIRVPVDSVFDSGEEKYVYVKCGDGREERFITTGLEGKYYIEVTEGLEEGEEVYYKLSDNSMMPDDYELIEVDYSSYSATKESPYTIESYTVKNYYAPVDGVVSEIYSEEKDITKGTNILKIETNDGGAAALAEIQNNMNMLTVQHEDALKRYDETIAANNEQINLSANTTTEQTIQSEQQPEQQPGTDYSDPNRILELQLYNQRLELLKGMENVSYSYNYRLLQEQYNNLAKVNDGSGVLYVKAEEDGILLNMNVSKGEKIKAGNKIFDTGVPITPVMLFSSNQTLHLNQKVTISDKDKVVEGRVIGVKKNNRYYVELNDCDIEELDSNLEIEYSTLEIDNAIILPDTAVYCEVRQKITDLDSDTEYFYVWKDVDGVLVKQYVDVLKESSDGHTNYCVTNGLEKGDRVAIENKEEK